MALGTKLVVGGGVALLALLFGSKPKKKAPGAPLPPGADAPGPNPSTPYVIRAGDSLVTLATATYGAANKAWAFAIFDRNPELSNPNLIRAGATIQIPTAGAIESLPPAIRSAYVERWNRYIALGRRDARYFTAAANPGDADPSITRRTPLAGSGLGYIANLSPFGLGSTMLATSSSDPTDFDAFY